MLTLRVVACTRRRLLVFAFPALVAPLASAQSFDRGADALLAIDQHRASVVEHIVIEWGAALAKSPAQVSIDALRVRLESLRADALLAASLAGTLDGLREVIGADDVSIPATKPGLPQTKALGDSAADVVYSPVTPCRLVDTRGTFAAVYQGNGTASHTPLPFTSNEIRSYILQGGNGVCLTQLPAGLNASAVQLQVFGIPTTSASGDIEILPQGATFGSTATMVYVATIPFNTVSTAAKANLATHQISVQVRGGGAHLAIDVVGYFAAPTGSGGKFFMQGGNTFGTAANLGTLDNQSVTVLVDNQPSLRLMPFNNGVHAGANVINGSLANGIAPGVVGATIAGGGDTGVGGPPSPNQITAEYGTIGGGLSNTSGAVSTVGGGAGNAATGGLGSIGGGGSNLASGELSTVGGGQHNTAGGFTATTGGGNFNTAAANYSVVAGGQNNAANGSSSAVGGGHNNTASGDQSAVGGGENNVASGTYATVVGGLDNAASGTYSVAAGFHANANGSGCFVFSDSSSSNVTSCFNPNVFVVRALNGFYFYTSGSSDATYAGVQLVGGSNAWASLSDRNSKENFDSVDPQEVLNKLVAVPIATWNWRSQGASVRHMGPMAQDFRAAFGLGEDDKHITTVDSEGVALAAIQALHKLVAEKDAELKRQDRQLTTMKRELEAIKARLGM